MEANIKAAAHLQQHGFVVIRTKVFNSSNVAKLRDRFITTVHEFPEYLQQAEKFVSGGFAALGNPASFHNPTVRLFRQWAMATLIPMFAKLCPTRQWRLEQIHDRMMFRLPGDSASPESWHRDEAPTAKGSDKTFGGWINLDEHPQYFSCIPGSHTAVRGSKGFAKISKNEGKALNDKRKLVKIPSGCILVFYEHILHEVMSKKLKYLSCRLFLGWRLTKDRQPLLASRDGLRAQLAIQAVMPLKSGQKPPMYPTLSWTNWRTALETWSVNTFPDDLLEVRRVESGPKKGDVHTVVKRELPSLAELGLPLYPRYTDSEFAMHVPSRTWTLLTPGQSKLRRTFQLHPLVENG